ncbi:Dinitrogenase iron-molybdenum cofactor biosynthesis protein [Desulfurobacterium thermolithotrophum DSM 11699]|uniref:Dinitrogenase iron-molybdenum cofactor biosynthesis protein n=1 Tax=Desulfurobacterium thermolithotrophum (strain DSM 11699 / BSA) TaxID=868864 RepID=F0S3Q1_DESTD|nr:NifB/NifX family molybdenum-iron cluster-binding protein [Desulfurobacterium thermolithotrophum]ADY73473.1 Dinitrogenase iron-molybdenum cofactor biosynthesis protein [Desulfurobacterium thermolithotrophum DSM 11699]
MKVAVPILDTEVQGKKLVNAHFGKSNYFAIVDIATEKLEVVKNPGLHLERGRGMLIADMFSEKNVKAVLVKEMGPGSFDKIRNILGIKVYLIPPQVKFLDDAIKKFKKGELEELLEPNEDRH